MASAGLGLSTGGSPAGPADGSGYDELHDIGQAQAQRLGAHLAEKHRTFDHVWCGPMKRHRATLAHMRRAAAENGLDWPQAEELASAYEVALEVLVREHLPRIVAECDDSRRLWEEATSQTEGATGAHSALVRLIARLVDGWRTGELSSQGVESWEEFRVRAGRALRETVSRSGPRGDVAVVTSMGVINGMLAAVAENAGAERPAFEWLETSSVSLVTFDEGRFALETVNDVSHLAGAAHLRAML